MPMWSDTCVSCGAYLPEGSMVCKDCRENSLATSKKNRRDKLDRKRAKSMKKNKEHSNKDW